MFPFRQHGEAPDCSHDEDKFPDENQPRAEIQNGSGHRPGAKLVEHSPYENYHGKVAGVESK